MARHSSHSGPVQIGDRFVRVSTYACLHETFIVVAIQTPSGHPPPARLLSDSSGDTRLVAVAALMGGPHWRPTLATEGNGMIKLIDTTDFTAKERDLIRREFQQRFGGHRPLASGTPVRRWVIGPNKGQAKFLCSRCRPCSTAGWQALPTTGRCGQLSISSRRGGGRCAGWPTMGVPCRRTTIGVCSTS